MPAPIVVRIHSAKFAGRRSSPSAVATAACFAASTAPTRHSSTVAGSSPPMLFWNGYGMKRSSIQTQASRSSVEYSFAHQPVDEPVVVLVVAEHHVAADVPGEPVLVGERGGEAADAIVRFEDHPVVVAQLGEPVAGAEAGRPGPDDDDARLAGHAVTPVDDRAGEAGSPAARYSSVFVGLIALVASFSANGISATSKPAMTAGRSSYACCPR